MNPGIFFLYSKSNFCNAVTAALQIGQVSVHCKRKHEALPNISKRGRTIWFHLYFNASKIDFVKCFNFNIAK